MKRYFLLLLLIPTILLLTSCGVDYSGTYGGQSGGIPVVMTLEKDGVATTNILGFPTSGHYKVSNGIIEITIEALGYSQTVSGKISKDKIEFSDMVLEKGVTAINVSALTDIIDPANQTSNQVATEAPLKNTSTPIVKETDDPNAAIYEDAHRHVRSKEYSEAIDIFEQLGDYKDSKEQVIVVKDTVYNEAATFFSHGLYSEAIDLFSIIRDYKDSNEQMELAKESKEYVENYFNYKYENIDRIKAKGLILCEYIGYGKSEIKIPYGVCAMRGTFRDNNSDITAVFLPETLIETQWYPCFSGCPNLTEITLPSSLQEIGSDCFASSSIESIVIPQSVDTIRDSAFKDCKKLTTVIIENNDIVFRNAVFYGCDHLSNITLPQNLKTIPDGCFYGCSSLKSIIIPESVTKITYRAFEYSGLETVTVPDSVNEFYHSVFANCSSLKTAYLSNSITVLDDTFWNCTALTYVKLPDNLERIEARAFNNCPKLMDIYLPRSLKKIHNDYFLDKAAITFHVVEGTYSHRFAAENGYKFDFEIDPNR